MDLIPYTTKLNSINAEQIPQIKRNDAEIPFRKANHLAIDVPPRECYADGYVDDLITAVLDFLRATNQARHAVPLTLNVMYRPVNDDDPIHRDKFLSRWKLTAEGGLEEIKTVLGWRIDMRILNLRTRRQSNKMDLGSSGNREKAVKQRISDEEASYILHEGRFFLNRISVIQEANSASQKEAATTPPSLSLIS